MNQKEKRMKLLSEFALLLVGILWGSSLIVVKSTTDDLSANAMIALRFSIACAVLACIFFKHMCGVTVKEIGHGAIIGAFLFGAYWIQTLGVTLGMPGKSAFLSSIYCVMVPFVHWLIGKKRPKKSNIIAAIICTVGIFVVSSGDGFSIEMGDALALLSGMFYALHIESVAKFARKDDPVRSTILQFAFCALYAWGVTFVLDGFQVYVSPDAWTGLLYLSLICTAVALLLQNIGQKYAEPNLASILMSTESIFAVLFSALFTGEKFNIRSIVGFAMVFCAIMISELAFDEKKNSEHL